FEVPSISLKQLKMVGTPVLVWVITVVRHEAEVILARVMVQAEDVADLVGQYVGVAFQTTWVMSDE
ncbi:MAG: hypothetical protein GTN93_33860, partial [Anaerolineae bacterium]|nr:hypothetical protein [Anaerolineae bacterium]